MIEKIKTWILRLAWIPLLTGVIGYCGIGGLDIKNGLYATIALYFVNPVSEIHNIFVYISQYTAVIVTATALVEFIISASSLLDRWLDLRKEDSIVIYTDNGNELAERIHEQEAFKNSVIEKDPEKFITKAKNHIVMFQDDLKSLDFLSANEEALYVRKEKDKAKEKKRNKAKVYVITDSIDSSLLKALDKSKIELHILNRYELMAREYWRQNNLEDSFFSKESLVLSPQTIKIAVIGYQKSGAAIFRYGYTNNIYSPYQRIEYHLWGCEGHEAAFVRSLDTMNDDIIEIHDGSPLDAVDEISKMDRIIIADTDDRLEVLQQLLFKDCNLNIHYYSENKIGLSEMFNGQNILVFGESDHVLTRENICDGKLYKMGKLLNYDFFLRNENKTAFDENEMESKWDEADGYSKASSIAQADHYHIRKRIELMPSVSKETVAEIEHIRWCRYMYSIHYSYDDKKPKDKEKRTHRDLIPFADLDQNSKDEKKKDTIFSEEIRRRLDELSSN